MHPLLPLTLLALLFVLPSTALALGEESFGNAPVVKQPEWADGVLAVANLKTRVYRRWVNGNESFYFQGDARALNEALRHYAAVKADKRQLLLLPGPGKTRSFSGKDLAFDWELHVPTGIYRAMAKRTHAVMTVYLNASKPRREVDRVRVKQWLDDLNADAFETRQNAERELEKLGYDVKPLLRAAHKASVELEPRRRIEGLLKKLAGLDVDDLEVPEGVTVVRVEEQVAAALKGIKDANQTVCVMAMQDLTGLAAYSDKAVPELIALLGKDRHEYLRRVAAGCLGSVGVSAKPAMAALKAGLEDADANVRSAFQAALQRIEQAKEMPGEDLKRKLLIVKDINEWKLAR